MIAHIAFGTTQKRFSTGGNPQLSGGNRQLRGGNQQLQGGNP